MILHIYGQRGPGDGVTIAGGTEALTRFRDALNEALEPDSTRAAPFDVQTNDGRQYRVAIFHAWDVIDSPKSVPTPYAPEHDVEEGLRLLWD